MATPQLTEVTLSDALGEILVSIRAGGREFPRTAVVLIHGFKGFRSWGFFPALADRLAKAGFTVVSYNASGSGVDASGEFAFPDRFGHNTYSAELADLRTVLTALVAGELGVVPPTSIGLFGHSRGGGIAVLQAAHDPRIKALATWATISTVDRWSEAQKHEWRERGKLNVVNARTQQMLPLYLDLLEEVMQQGKNRLDIGAAAEAIGAPWLLLHGEEDESVPADESERLYRLNGKGTTQFKTVNGAGHTFGAVHPLDGIPETLERAIQATLDWYGTHLT